MMWTSNFSLPGLFQCIAFLPGGWAFVGEHVLAKTGRKNGVFEGKLIPFFYFSFVFFVPV